MTTTSERKEILNRPNDSSAATGRKQITDTKETWQPMKVNYPVCPKHFLSMQTAVSLSIERKKRRTLPPNNKKIH